MGSHRVLLQLLSQLESTHTSHHHIQQQQIIGCNIHFQSLFGRIGCIHMISFYLDIETQDFTQILFIINNKNSFIRLFHNLFFNKFVIMVQKYIFYLVISVTSDYNFVTTTIFCKKTIKHSIILHFLTQCNYIGYTI